MNVKTNVKMWAELHSPEQSVPWLLHLLDAPAFPHCCSHHPDIRIWPFSLPLAAFESTVSQDQSPQGNLYSPLRCLILGPWV